MDNLILLSKDLVSDYVIDVYESLIWTVRYKEAGDFELYTPISEDILSKIAVGKYFLSNRFFNESRNEAHLMIIETIEIDQTHVKVTGRDLKSILDRRIVWDKTEIAKDTDICTAITTLLNDAMLNPSRTNRKIENFVFESSGTEWPKYEDLTQYEGDTLLSVMNDICSKFKVGFEVVYNFSDKRFHMRLIKPVDHTYDQLHNTPVIFSAAFNNLKSYKFIESVSTYRNVVLVAGERYQDDELNKFFIWDIAGDDNLTGLERREGYIDAGSVVHEDEYANVYGDDEDAGGTYKARLREYGKTQLNKKEYAYIKDYEGEADPALDSYIFMKDYNIGDIVEIVTPYGMGSVVRVSEMVLSISTSGRTLIPTLTSVKEEET